MTEDEKKTQEYSNLCSKLGDLIITKQIIEFDIEQFTIKAKQVLKEIHAQPKT
jgi:hypothetical protein